MVSMTLPLLLGTEADRVSAETRNSKAERSALDSADVQHASAAVAAQLRDAVRRKAARLI